MMVCRRHRSLMTSMGMLTDADGRVLAQLEIVKPCETLLTACPERAAWAVFVDHHRQGCGTIIYRCDWHYNLLLLEARRLVDRICLGFWMYCGDCGVLLSSRVFSDYVRGIRL